MIRFSIFSLLPSPFHPELRETKKKFFNFIIFQNAFFFFAPKECCFEEQKISINSKARGRNSKTQKCGPYRFSSELDQRSCKSRRVKSKSLRTHNKTLVIIWINSKHQRADYNFSTYENAHTHKDMCEA